MVDNRLVNAECKPVGSMTTAPLHMNKAMRGAIIFTTLDCQNAFYSLPPAEEDWELIETSSPELLRLRLTGIPVRAKVSMRI